ncbi:MAG: ribonuclease H-like domain-containing protein [Eubacteriales bacterium]
MKVFDNVLPNLEITYPINGDLPLEEFLFIDIETTGFTAAHSELYLIGVIYYKETEFHLLQWFAQSPQEEQAILEEFLNFVEPYIHLVHFNGNQFDIPYLMNKCEQYQLSHSLGQKAGLDLYKQILPYKKFLKLTNCKQRTLEEYLSIDRTDVYNGGELIDCYREYVEAPSDQQLNMLLLHNAEDVLGLLLLLPILAYADLTAEGAFSVKKVQANSHKDINGVTRQELLIHISVKQPLPVAISSSKGGCYFSASDTSGYIKVPLLTKELKYFYANYGDYYYLPDEDVAIHKNLATYVNSKNRQKALASNCYTRKESKYLPQYDTFVKPFFKESYQSKELYFEMTDELKRERPFFVSYAAHILEYLIL